MDLMEKVISLCKRRGFVYPNSEIYGGNQGFYDFGPLGVEMKNNLKRLWWKWMTVDHENIVGIDGAIISHPKVWEASGHVKSFVDPLSECKKCHHRFKADDLTEDKCPDCGGKFTEERKFSLLFKAMIGPVEEEQTLAYLRGETAQNIFVNFKNVLDSTRMKIPFGIGQMGKAFRNEITTGNFIFRTLEFELMEIEYFISPESDWNKIFEEWLGYIYGYADLIGLLRKNLYNHEIPNEERAFYSKRTIDIEYKFPFGQDELWAIAYRTDYDLSRHQEFSGQRLEYLDEQTKKKYIPHVIEPTFGVDRTLLAILSEAYAEEKDRVVLKLNPKMAPYKVAIFPLLANKPQLVEMARKIYSDLKKEFTVVWDDRGNIGKRYYSQDEIGTPWCVTVDFETLGKNDVTLRDRDTMKQERIKNKDLVKVISQKLNVS